MTSDRELKAFDFIRLVMTFIIVLYHSCVIFALPGWGGAVAVNESAALELFVSWLRLFAVRTFFFASGYIFYYLKYESGKYGDFGPSVRKKAVRLLIPYAFTSLIWAILFKMYFNGTGILQIIRDFVLMESPAQLWFLIVLFCIFVCFFLLCKRIDFSKLSVKQLAAWALLFYIFYIVRFGLSYAGIPDVFQILSTLRFILFFFLGMIFRKIDTSRLYKWKYAVILFAITILSVFVNEKLLVGGAIMKGLQYAIFPVCNIFGILMIVAVCGLLEKRFCLSEKVPRALYDTSFPVYLFHQQIIYVTLSLFNRPEIHPFLLTAINFVISYNVSFGISMVLRKFKVTRFMFGMG